MVFMKNVRGCESTGCGKLIDGFGDIHLLKV